MAGNKHVQAIQDELDKKVEVVRKDCITKFGAIAQNYTGAFNDYVCPAVFDGLICWPPTSAGTNANHSCPSFIDGFNMKENATRQCMDDGTWYYDTVLKKFWTNYNACYISPTITVFIDNNKTSIPNEIQYFFPSIKLMHQTGYFISFTTLMVAFFIMLSIKKLRCARNILHMHLFASFMFRAFISFVISLTFMDGTMLLSDIREKDDSIYFHITTETNNWPCKLILSLKKYFNTANYSWILMEGLYLHNLIFRALFAESSNSIKWYVINGWGLPLIVTACWVAARLYIGDTYCWTTLESYGTFLIGALPIMFSILINFFLFIRISMVLYSKLRSPINEDSKRYSKWFKSTLILVPLFGIHYVLFFVLLTFKTSNRVVEVIYYLGDQFFGSFQGFFVAILYCFLNGEVKAEIQPHFFYFLTFLATNNISKYFFPCRKKFLRSIGGRSSICTTMSCSSLYTNGIVHKGSKNRLDLLPRLQQNEKLKDHICKIGNSHENLKSYRHSQPFNYVTETTLSLDQKPNKYHSESEIHDENSKMIIHNNF